MSWGESTRAGRTGPQERGQTDSQKEREKEKTGRECATTGREEGSSQADRKEGKEISGAVAGPGDACSLGQPEPEP